MLKPAAVTTQVKVSAKPPPIDPAQTAVSSSIDTERIEELPVESRNYLNFALLAPGVSGSAQQPVVFGAGLMPQAGFLQPLAGQGARRLQFSLDYEF